MFFLGLALASVARASPERLTCQVVFERLFRTLKDGNFSDPLHVTRAIKDQTVFHIPSLKDERGDEYYVFEKNGKLWGSSASTNNFDPQGDPRWFIEVIGTDLAHVWGLYWDRGDKLQAPSPKLLEKRMSAVSQQLRMLGHEPIPIKFNFGFSETEKEFKDLKKRSLYIESFINDSALPFEDSGLRYLHDLSYHSGAVLLSSEFLKEARARFEYWYSAYRYLEELSEKIDDINKQRAIQALAGKLRIFIVEAIDNGTGLINPLIVNQHLKKNFHNTDTSDIDEKISEHLIKHLLGSNRQTQSTQLGVILSEASRKTVVSDHYSFSLEELLELMLPFDQNFKSSFPGFHQNALTKWTSEKLCLVLMLRREQIREASLMLSTEMDLVGPFQKIDQEHFIKYYEPMGTQRPKRSILRRLFFGR